jgi:Uma2 family endonuclease
MNMPQTQTPLDTWLVASWDEFVKLADDPSLDKLKSYYHDGKMRFEPMSTGSDHSKDHTAVILAIGLYAMSRGIPLNGHDGCSFRKAGFAEFQPDVAYYVREQASAIPRGTRIVDLDVYPLPSLVIEISDTSLADDKGEKRLQYEEMGIPEYWIVDVQNARMIAFAITPDGTSRRIRESQILSGLQFTILEEALQRSHQQDQSAIMAWLMEQFR